MLRTFAFALGAAAAAPLLRAQNAGQPIEAQPASGDRRTALHQEIDLKASAAQVEGVLLDQKQFSSFTRLPATIDPREGGAFSLFGGLIVGRNVELVPATRIVQAWRPTHWAPGVYSVVRFALSANGGSTRVVLDHTGFPEGEYDHLYSGWNAHYWDPLKSLFA